MSDHSSPTSHKSDSNLAVGNQANGSRGEYIVVARRYRPQTFEELIGQEHVSQPLMGAISSGRVGHAYLFTGARGTGKTSAARILAKALNCVEGTSPIPCNHCEICHSVSNGDDVDVLEIDGASNRGIDEIRQLRRNAIIRPSRSRFKIYIIDEVHMLTKEAFNALLKTLEEPPEHVKFIFATTEPNKIPVTILSRCQRYDFAGIDTEAIQTRLSQIAISEGVSIDSDALQILAMRANGSMRDSQSLLEQLLATDDSTITATTVTTLLGIAPAARLSRLVRPLVDHNAALALAELDEAIGEGAEVSQLLDQLLGYFRDVMTQAVGCKPNQMLYALPGQWDEVRQTADQLGIQTILAIVQILDQTAAQMRLSTQTRILAEMAIVRLCHLQNLDALATLIDEVKGLPAGAQAIVPSAQAATKRSSTTQTKGTQTKGQSTTGQSTGRKAIGRKADSSATANPSSARSTNPPDSGCPNPQTMSTPTKVTTGSTGREGPSGRGGVELTSANAQQLWQQALTLIQGLASDNAALADEVNLTEDGRLVIHFPQQYSTCRDFCDRPTNRERLEKALAEVVGKPTAIELKTHTKRPDSAISKNPSQTKRLQQVEITSEPFVQRALELFDGDQARIHYVPPKEKT